MSASPIDTGWEAFYQGHEYGLTLIPGRRGTKNPLVLWKPYQTRRPTDSEISQWRKQFPEINPLMVTGQSSGVIVLDQDGEEAHEYITKYGEIPATVMVRTPRGEFHRHYWFRYSRSLGDIRNFIGGYYDDLPHIDLRANGGLAAYPGSINAERQPYTFIAGRGLEEVEIADLQQCNWLHTYIQAHKDKLLAQETERQATQFEAERMQNLYAESLVLRLRQPSWNTDFETRMKRYAEVTRQNQLEELANCLPGGRNNKLFHSACVLAAFLNDGVWTQAELERDLEVAAIAAGLDRDPNCGLTGIRRTIVSGLSVGRRNRVNLRDRPFRGGQR